MHTVIAQHADEVVALCRKYGVKRLDLFGSAARDDFDPARSDLDFLVEFEQVLGLRQFFGLKEELEALFGRQVDLVEEGAVRNPIVRASMEEDRLPVYAA